MRIGVAFSARDKVGPKSQINTTVPAKAHFVAAPNRELLKPNDDEKANRINSEPVGSISSMALMVGHRERTLYSLMASLESPESRIRP
jgi:hypothetical protein